MPNKMCSFNFLNSVFSSRPDGAARCDHKVAVVHRNSHFPSFNFMSDVLEKSSVVSLEPTFLSITLLKRQFLNLTYFPHKNQ